MIRRFISMEWKQFFRASYFQKGLAIKILLVLAALYFGGIAILSGAGLFFILKKAIPEVDPIVTINNFLIFWILFEMLIRFFMQQLPVMNIKPLMIIPIKRNTVIHYLLGKTTLSFFNFLPLFFFLPFAIVLMTQGYPVTNVVCWFFSVMFLSLGLNYLNFLINKNNAVFYAIAGLLMILIGLEYFQIYNIIEPIGEGFNHLYKHPYLVIIPLVFMMGMYFLNYKYIKQGFYLDDAVSKKVKEVNATDLSWMDRFGSVAPFLKNDIKLIWRNVRPKQVMFMSFMFLFYGLIFYTQEIYREMPAFLAFASMFVTGGFLMTFGQLVPSWDSEYYKMLMSQNIPYKKYLESKWYLMVVAVAISFVLSTPYLYFGWEIFGMIAAGALFNVGLNSFITLFGGALNRVPIELNVKAKAFSNTNGFNPTQMLIALPKFLLPMLLFYIPYKLINFNAGLIILGLSGVLGLVFRNFFLNKIESIYQKGKYKTISAFSEKK
ncbi:MAG: hypothetical protein KJO41_09570 [Bacteroidia bacterium]|nr:hypothetical protein [Bacteroidia bacterium]NND25694.1 hypothetical protein [Flavobacteriaceae bacterium]MBT8279240.1 hypothetical protein [Bacteroidia bacterium]NNK59776.1 hypothetical protein [Flavobacteriaceae bacterium]NNL32040.1 hypothetical protein [Flavobacteriaceae bacterium]